MKRAMWIGAALACALAATQASLAENDAAPTAPPRFSVVTECGKRFVELRPQRDPLSMTWGRFGDPIDAYYGVEAYSHGQDDAPDRRDGSGRYQCTELIHRYIRTVFGMPSRIGLGMGNGVDLARGVADRFGGQSWRGGLAAVRPVYLENGETTCRPTVGAIVSVAMPQRDGRRGAGHVGILRTLEREGDALTGIVFEQHGGASYTATQVIRPGRVRFVRDAQGVWRGTYTTGWGAQFNVVGWTNFAAE